MISPMRLMLAAAALLIVYLEPSQPHRLVGLTYSLLVIYTIYSAVILLLAGRAPHLLPLGYLHWIDLACYVALLSVSGGASSIFFVFFFFAILAASFRWGYSSGLRVTIVATLLFVIVSYMSSEPHLELNRFLLRAVTLLVLGYMMAHWGGSEVQLKRQLRLLKDVTNLSNPRFGINRTISLALEQLRSFYDADTCILIYREGQSGSYKLTRIDRQHQEMLRVEEINDESAAIFLSPPPGIALVQSKPSRSFTYDLETGRSSTTTIDAATIANALDTEAFASIPLSNRSRLSGRLYIAGTRQSMNQGDIEFLLQVIEHTIPLLDNIRLLDRLASEAADQERKKLARDIHDSVIQPYVGLQLGLAAVRQKLLQEKSPAFEEVNELCEAANEEVRALRRYLDGLKTDEANHEVLFAAVRRFAIRYSTSTGIDVDVTGEEGLQLNDRLAGEAFQMIVEALSNVRRHTHAQKAEVEIRCDKRNLLLKVRNENVDGAASPSFRPASITERASALGGDAEVYLDEHDRTVVGVRIPL